MTFTNLIEIADHVPAQPFFFQKKSRIIAIEVKSNAERYNSGLAAIRNMYNPYATLIVGRSGMSPEEFLSINPNKLFE